jgi:hypothetical protein
MKKKEKILFDVDFIGGESPLTVAETQALSDFFKQYKLVAKAKMVIKKKRVVKRLAVTV